MNKCIVILSYNHPELTSRTIQSCLDFSLPILLVHNGSNAKNKAILKERFSSVIHIEIEVNKGFTGGVNFGLTKAFENYEWALFLTNDTELKSLDFNFQEPAFIAPLIYFRKMERVDSMGGGFSPHTGKLRHLKSTNDKVKKNEYFYVPGTAFALHKTVFNNVGFFDESLGTYWEDVDFSVRAQNLNQKTYYSEKIKVLHRVGKTCHDNPYYTTYLFKRNRKKISLKYSSLFYKLIFIAKFSKELFLTSLKLIKSKDKIRLQLLWKAVVD